MDVDFKNITALPLSNFVVYSVLSVGYVWMSPEMANKARASLNRNEKLGDVFSDPSLLNFIGISLFNMPYSRNNDGTYSFKMPAVEENTEEYISYGQTLGEIYKRIIKPIQTRKIVEFVNPTIFMLYNNKIEVSDDITIHDINIINIITNVISVYIAQKYKEGLNNG